MKEVILIGVDGFGAQWAEPCELNGCKIVAIVDYNASALAEGKKKYAICDSMAFDGSNLSWAAIKADIVIDAATPYRRKERIIAALNAGKDVIIAKPPAFCLEDIQEIIACRDKNNKSVHVAMQKRYFPVYNKIKEIIDKGTVGKLIYGQINLHVDGTYWRSGLHWRTKMLYPSLIDGSIHYFDLLKWWTGMHIYNVTAASWNSAWSDFRSDSNFIANINMEKGTTINCISRWDWKYGNVINYFDGVRLEFENGYLENIGGKLYINNEYFPLDRDGTELMDTGKLNIYVMQDIIQSLKIGQDLYNTSIDHLIEPFLVMLGCTASIINEKKIYISGIENKLTEYKIDKNNMDYYMKEAFE